MKKNKGFTLVELLIVIVILGILFSIAMPKLINARFKTLYSGCVFNIRTIATSLESYNTNDPTRNYPNPARNGTVPFDKLEGFGVTDKMRYCPTKPDDANFIYRYAVDINNNPRAYTITCISQDHMSTINKPAPIYNSSAGFINLR